MRLRAGLSPAHGAKPGASRPQGWATPLGLASLEQVFLYLLHDQLGPLVVDAGGEHKDAGRALWGQLADTGSRIERVPGVDRAQEARGLLDQPEQRPFHQKRELPRARGRMQQHLEPVRQELWIAVAAAELAVIVDRMIVAGGGLEGQSARG